MITREGIPMPALTTRDLAALVVGELHGCANVLIEDVATLETADRRHVVFVDGQASIRKLASAAVGAVLVSTKMVDAASGCDAPLICVDDPMAAFVTVMLHFRPATGRPQVGLSPAAHISPSATFGADCHVFPGATVSADVVCGERCIIHPGVYVGSGCRLGDDVTLFPNAVLYEGVTLGHRVMVHATAVIGGDGFGYRFSQGRYHKIPHTGTVIVEDDVEIGCGTTIDRGMIDATVIGAGTKLDNQVMIAHNCRIGKHNAFASQVGLAGSTTSGDYVRCGGQAGIADHSHLGTGCSIGAKAGLFGTVPDGADYHGYPAGPAKEQYRIVMTLQRLPEMRKQLLALEADMQRLKSHIAQDSKRAADEGPQQSPAAA